MEEKEFCQRCGHEKEEHQETFCTVALCSCKRFIGGDTVEVEKEDEGKDEEQDEEEEDEEKDIFEKERDVFGGPPERL